MRVIRKEFVRGYRVLVCAEELCTDKSRDEGHGELLHEENYVQASPGKKKCVLCARSVQTRTEFLQHEERLHVK